MKRIKGITMVEFIKKVRKYGTNRRHIEVPRDYFDDLDIGDVVVVLDKATYNELKKKNKKG